jgi:hypothetical protein
VPREHLYCLLHDPIRAMYRNPNPQPRKRDTERLLQEVRAEREHDLSLLGEGEGTR